jgi:rhodanese-related sulfurtransferase
MHGEAPLWRGAVILVAVGAALGVTHNWIGLRSRPVHGIPWVAVEQPLPTLESIDSADSVLAARSRAETARAPIPGASSGPGSSAPPAAGAPKPHGAGTGSTPAAPPPAAEATRAPEPPAAPNESRPPASVPFIPEMSQPIQVGMDGAKRLFDAQAALFVDARDASEYEEGHIAGAIRLTRDEALANPDRVRALGAPSRPIVSYCNGGRCEASRELAQVLVGAGFRRVLVFAGGFPEWAAAGHPVARGSAP